MSLLVTPPSRITNTLVPCLKPTARSERGQCRGSEHVQPALLYSSENVFARTQKASPLFAAVFSSLKPQYPDPCSPMHTRPSQRWLRCTFSFKASHTLTCYPNYKLSWPFRDFCPNSLEEIPLITAISFWSQTGCNLLGATGDRGDKVETQRGEEGRVLTWTLRNSLRWSPDFKKHRPYTAVGNLSMTLSLQRGCCKVTPKGHLMSS